MRADARLHVLDAPLDLAHAVEVLAHAGGVARAESVLQLPDLADDRVENAPILGELPAALFSAEALSEQPLEDDARVGLHRQRGRRRAPRQRVHVAAGVTDIAAAHSREVFRGDLQRAKLGVVAEYVRGHLVDGLAAAHVRALCALRMHTRQPYRARARMIA